MQFEIENDSKPLIPAENISILICNELSYNDFFNNYMKPNFPCIIKDVGKNWEATMKWITQEKRPNFLYLKNHYGSCDVTIYNCNEKYYNSQKTHSEKFSTYLENWGCESYKSHYLKDWHLKNTFKDDNFYQVPQYFGSDWLNEYLVEKNEDDYRFVYMGQEGTWTPFHADVFNSFSWSTNVCGKKRWVLFPPGEENKMKDSFNNLPFDITGIYKKYKHFEVTQNCGEAIFVPSGWYHQVWNLADTISVNHNWVNGCNIMKMWTALEENLDKVKKEIEDCCDMENFLEHCQVVLKASFGLDFFKFYDFLKFIALKRCEQIEQKEMFQQFHGHYLGLKHAQFDLKAVVKVLEKFIQHSDVKILFATTDPKPEDLFHKITVIK